MFIQKFIPFFFTSLSQALHLLAGVGECCRFEPSCSQYASQAYRTHGMFHATRLTLSRIWRCRPGKAFGFDPVPQNVRSI